MNSDDELFQQCVTHFTTGHEALEHVQEGGAIRGSRGTLVENMIDIICHSLGIEVRIGTSDLQTITIMHKDREYRCEHQVDRHLYAKGKLIAIVECKAYLDSCYYVRASSDFKRMKMAHPSVKAFVFALENSISENALVFTDADFDNSCDGIFYMCDGKRSSSKPIYKKEFAKPLNRKSFDAFVTTLRTLLC